MSTKDAFKGNDEVDTEIEKLKLLDSLQQFEEKTRGIQQNLSKVEAVKKDKDAIPTLEALDKVLDESFDHIRAMEREMQDAKETIDQKLGRAPAETRDMRRSNTLLDNIPPSTNPCSQSSSKLAPQPRIKLNPVTRHKSLAQRPMDQDDQVIAYELKSQLLKNVEMQNQKLKTEFTLHEKMTESRMLNQQNKRLHADVSLSRANSMRLIKLFEKKAKEADAKLKEMKQELNRSQDLAEKYKNLYELERRKTARDTDHLPPVEEVAERLPTSQSSYSFLAGNVRINDIIRKNEVLLEESATLKREIKRLKEDNAKLIKQTKQAMSDRDQMLHKLETSESNRKNLLKRLEKEKDQHHQLSRSMTRQASDWILLKKQIAQFDEEYRWSQLRSTVMSPTSRPVSRSPRYSRPNVGNMNPQAAEDRVRMHPVTKNVYMPRKMFPVEQYDKA